VYYEQWSRRPSLRGRRKLSISNGVSLASHSGTTS
jgi:hypothetical protein